MMYAGESESPAYAFFHMLFFPNKVPVHMLPVAHMAAPLLASVDRTIMVDVLLHVKWCILQL